MDESSTRTIVGWFSSVATRTTGGVTQPVEALGAKVRHGRIGQDLWAATRSATLL